MYVIRRQYKSTQLLQVHCRQSKQTEQKNRTKTREERRKKTQLELSQPHIANHTCTLNDFHTSIEYGKEAQTLLSHMECVNIQNYATHQTHRLLCMETFSVVFVFHSILQSLFLHGSYLVCCIVKKYIYISINM